MTDASTNGIIDARVQWRQCWDTTMLSERRKAEESLKLQLEQAEITEGNTSDQGPMPNSFPRSLFFPTSFPPIIEGETPCERGWSISWLVRCFVEALVTWIEVGTNMTFANDENELYLVGIQIACIACWFTHLLSVSNWLTHPMSIVRNLKIATN